MANDKASIKVSARPLSIKDIRHHLETNTLAAPKQTLVDLRRLLREPFPLEVFDFGTMYRKHVHELVGDAKPFLEADLLPLPFEPCVFRIVTDDLHDVGLFGTTTFLWEKFELRSSCTRGFSPRYSGITCSKIENTNVATAIAFGFSFPNKIFLDPEAMAAAGDTEKLSHAVGAYREDVIAGLMILHTRGVRKTRVCPSDKQQAARAKAGKPPLPYTTTIDTREYFEAMRNSERRGGTHASPRPHLRRAHLRRYQKEDGEKIVPIPASLVNWDGTPLQREAYRVRV